MTSLLNHALACIERGWAVFPCMPRSKAPATKNGLNAATKFNGPIHHWWQENPSYNPALNLGLSELTVLDVDAGLGDSRENAQLFCEQFPRTFTVRTGRRPDWGIQLYFSGTTSNRPYEWSDGRYKVSGEVRSTGYYVMAPGAIHDKTGETYQVLRDLPCAPIPDVILQLSQRKIPKPVLTDEKVGSSFRHYYLTQRSVELFSAGLAGKGLVDALVWLYETRCERDAAKDAKVKAGELASIAQWAEANITPGLFREDTQLVARLLVDDPEWKRAWEGNVSDVAAAFEYLVARLFAQGSEVKPWAVERICKASPLHKRMERE